MKHTIPAFSTAALSAAACVLLGLAAPPVAAQTAATVTPPAAAPVDAYWTAHLTVHAAN